MRAIAVLLGIALAIAATLVGWQMLQRTSERHVPASGRPASVTPEVSATTSNEILVVPLPASELQRREYESKRVPFLSQLNTACRSYHATCHTGEDLDVLEVVLEPAPDGQTPSVHGVVEPLRDEAIRRGAWTYGYRRILFLQSQAEGSGKPPALVAEITRTENGRWVTFLR